MTATARRLVDVDEVRRQAIAEELLDAVRHRLEKLAAHDAEPTDDSKRLLRLADERLSRAEHSAQVELAGVRRLHE